MIKHRAISNVFLFFIVFIFTALTVNYVLRHFDMINFDRGRMDYKIDLFLNEYADSNVVFIGTSRTDRQIDIPYFQTKMKSLGCPESAYNLGIPNLTYEELRYVLYRIRNATPNYIIFEEPIYGQNQLNRIETNRVRSFSTWSGTYNRLQNIWTYQEDIPRKIYRSGIAILSLIYEQSNLGHFSKIVFPGSNKGEEEIILKSELKDARGFISMDQQGKIDKNISKLHDKFLKNEEKFKAAVREELNNNYTSFPAEPRASLIRSILGIAPTKTVLFFPPLLERSSANAALTKTLREDLTVLNYNQPEIYPQFWSASQWYDEWHLNENASRELTSLIAQDLCPLMIKGQD